MKRTLLSALLAASLPVSAADALDDCLQCHRPDNRQGEVPMIEGQHAGYLEAQLQRFRDRHRQAFPMDAVARGLDDADISRLVADLASRPWRNVPATRSSDPIGDGQALLQRFGCAECHGPQLHGGDVIPRIAGQHPGYLARQIEGFGDDDRYHPPTATGARMRSFDAAEAAALAAAINAAGADAAGK